MKKKEIYGWEHSPRPKENQTINKTRLAYTDGGPGFNNHWQKYYVENV
jgi:hypothetical protein